MLAFHMPGARGLPDVESKTLRVGFSHAPLAYQPNLFERGARLSTTEKPKPFGALPAHSRERITNDQKPADPSSTE